MITKKLLAMIMFASVIVNGVPLPPTNVPLNQPIVSAAAATVDQQSVPFATQRIEENVVQQQQPVQQEQQQAVVGSEGLPLQYPGFSTIQPMVSSEVGAAGGQLQYNTAPIMEQLRSMSPDSNFGRLGAFPSAGIMEQQTSTFDQAIHGEAKPIPQSFVQPMIDRAMSSTSLPYTQAVTAPIEASFPTAKAPKPIKEFKVVNAPITNQYETLEVKELPNIVQHYAVPSTFTTQENIKQPITQPVWQPYLQRYEQRAVPIVQPVVNRVMQPVIHRQLHPFLTSKTIQGPQQDAIINAPKVLEFNNQPIVGSELDALAMDDRSHVPSLPVMGAATSKRPAAVEEPKPAASKSHSSAS